MKQVWMSIVIIVLIGFRSYLSAEDQTLGFPLIRVTYHLQDWLGAIDKVEQIRVGGVTIHATPLVFRFYQTRGFRPAWSNDHGPILADIDKVLTVLRGASNEGLDPENYHLKKIEKILRRVRPGGPIQFLRPIRVAALDLLLTDAFFLYASHLSQGRVDPRGVDEQLPAVVRTFFLPEMLEEVLVTGKIHECFSEIAPIQPEYLRLRRMLMKYRQLEKTLDAVKIASVPPLKKGARDPKRIPALRIKLHLLGDLEEVIVVDDTFFNKEIETALKLFQQRHGLEATGVMDEKTAVWLNLPGKDYIKRLEVNLERLRWHPMNWEADYIVVNIPDFSLAVVQQEKEVLTMRVVTGQTYRKTPIFSDSLRFIVINPFWEIPPSIILRDKLYAIRYEPDFFKKRNIKVIRGWGKSEKEINPANINWKKVRIRDFFEKYRLRQASGPGNPLGRIKFMFPNDYNVYLHDTSQRELFDRAVRSFSSGCIRLEKPYALAVHCLRHDRFWNKSRLRSALKGKLEQKIKLTNPLPIHILYWTAWVDASGRVNFREDIYQRDEKIRQAFADVYFPDYQKQQEAKESK
ncbi:L,D-transpeptidase family protein [bacterium]|nr:L,D-transpeptidase family protein [bacterium]